MKNLSAEEVKEFFYKSDKIMLIDVRTVEEVKRGKIAGSISIPLDEIETRGIEILQDKNAKIVLYCLSGSRSAIAVEFLEDLGYTNIYNLRNGLLGWRAKEYPLI